jgi:signal transduction histidine kinase
MPWQQGPCAVVLLRQKGPPPWLSMATMVPAILSSLAVILIALLAAGPTVGRIRRLTEEVKRLDGQTSRPIQAEGDDEIAELARVFEQSRQTIETQLQSLRERESALRDYISNTTHDVMSPLSVLQGHLVALQQRLEAAEPLPPEAIAPILEEAHYLGSLLHNLNASARLQARNGLAHRDALELDRLVQRVVERHRPIAERKGVALELATPNTPVRFVGDLTLLEQALGNVVQNAIRYNAPRGHVAVVLDGDSEAWTLRVADDGPGIAESDRSRVLEPEFRGSQARTRHPHGMGLGLHIAKSVAERHALALQLSETPGGGLTVQFSYPA